MKPRVYVKTVKLPFPVHRLLTPEQCGHLVSFESSLKGEHLYEIEHTVNCNHEGYVTWSGLEELLKQGVRVSVNGLPAYVIFDRIKRLMNEISDSDFVDDDDEDDED